MSVTAGGPWRAVPARHVLVAYASKMGSTREIAEMVAAEIRAAGHDATARDAGEVDDVTPYDAVVVGSALYSTRWRPDATRLLRRHRHELATRPVWLFQSGPCGQDAHRQLTAPRPVRRLAAQLGCAEPITFGGKLDTATATGWMSRSMAKGDMAGDWRDWNAIRDWAARIAAELSPATAGG